MRKKLKEARGEAGMKAKITQEELERRSGVSRTIISGLDNGSITVTTTNTLSKIAKALGRKVGDIFLIIVISTLITFFKKKILEVVQWVFQGELKLI